MVDTSVSEKVKLSERRAAVKTRVTRDERLSRSSRFIINEVDVPEIAGNSGKALLETAFSFSVYLRYSVFPKFTTLSATS